MNFEASLAETNARLRKIERWEWWRWATVMIISLTLMAGLFSLSYPNARPDIVSVNDLDTALWALLAMVLLFNVFALYQQFKITNMRRELASQIAMLCTLEALRPPNVVEEVHRSNRRRVPRFYLDKRLTVTVPGTRPARVVYGRTRDISEGGVGAVLTDQVEPGSKATLQFPVDFQDAPLVLNATVCYRRGFSHGFELIDPTPNEVAIIRRICSNCQRAEVQK
jgi:hypothetical protein